MAQDRGRRRWTRPLTALAGLVLLALALGAGSGDEEVGLAGVTTSFSGRALRVDARLSPGLPPDVTERCASGLPTSTSWEVRLYAYRDVWFDGLKDERRYEATAAYRPVSSDWVVERRLDGKLLETRTAASLSEATAALSAVRELPVFTMGPHLIGKRLVVKVRCTYASGVSLGVVPTSASTSWARSPVFVWDGEPRP